MTIKDLAALSGYSLGTVSRVLNNQPHVSEKAREQIMAIVKEQGFELNTNARNLKQTHSNNILVIVRGTHNELFAALVERLQTVATGGEYQLVVDYIGELDNEVRRAVKRVREVKPQGILFLGGSSEDFIESFAEIHIPAVLVTNSAAEFQFKNLSSVTTDDTAAAGAAVGYLADMGHKKIAVIGGEREYSDTGRLRYAGVLRALTERGMTFDADRYYKTAHYRSRRCSPWRTSWPSARPALSAMPESASRRTFPSSALTACPFAGTTSRGSPPLRSRSRSWRKRATPCCST